MRPKQLKIKQPKFFNPNWGIGQFLAYQRKRFGITNQSDFADRLKISRFHLANIESGRTPLPMDIAWKACQELNIHPGFLVSTGVNWCEPFEALDADDVAKAEGLINANRNARFIELWPALFQIIFGNGNSATRRNEVILDKAAGLPQDSDVKQIRSLPQLLVELRKLTKDRGAKVALANQMKVTRQAVDQWLSGDSKPTAEMTFELISWVEDQRKRIK